MFNVLKLQVCASPNMHVVVVIWPRYQTISHSLQQVNSNSPVVVNDKLVDVYRV